MIVGQYYALLAYGSLCLSVDHSVTTSISMASNSVFSHTVAFFTENILNIIFLLEESKHAQNLEKNVKNVTPWTPTICILISSII